MQERSRKESPNTKFNEMIDNPYVKITRNNISKIQK